MTFAKRIKEAMVKNASGKLLNGLDKQGRPYPHILQDRKDNFIDRICPEKRGLKGNLPGSDNDIPWNGATHLNSSQALCVNFFQKFFEEEPWENLLLRTLQRVGVPIEEAGIASAAFEYEPDNKERTAYDFYFEMKNGCHGSVEVKYTEAEFGDPDKHHPERYHRQWENVYRGLVNRSPWLHCDEEGFYKNYQINRNICHAGERDIVLFLTPRANNAKHLSEGRDYIDSLTAVNPLIRNIYWEDVVRELMPLIADDSDLAAYYGKFKEKYIDIL